MTKELDQIVAEATKRMKEHEAMKGTFTINEINDAKDSLEGEINGLIVRFQNKYSIGVNSIKLNTWKDVDGTKYCDETRIKLSIGEILS